MNVTNRSPSESELNLILEGYKLLVSLLQHEETLFWQRNQFFFTFNGALFAVFGWLGSERSNVITVPQNFPAFACLIGAFSCVFWFLIIQRGKAFYDHWYEQLKYLEREYLVPLEIFQKADTYFNFKVRKVTLGDDKFELSNWAVLKIYSGLSIASLVFLLVWLLMSFYFWSQN